MGMKPGEARRKSPTFNRKIVGTRLPGRRRERVRFEDLPMHMKIGLRRYRVENVRAYMEALDAHAHGEGEHPTKVVPVTPMKLR